MLSLLPAAWRCTSADRPWPRRSALHGLEAGLEANRAAGQDLRVLLLTHIHLDHAGATGTLLQTQSQNPGLCPPDWRTVLIDPTRLLRSATRLYGDQMDYLWGEFLPAPAGM